MTWRRGPVTFHGHRIPRTVLFQGDGRMCPCHLMAMDASGHFFFRFAIIRSRFRGYAIWHRGCIEMLLNVENVPKKQGCNPRGGAVLSGWDRSPGQQDIPCQVAGNGSGCRRVVHIHFNHREVAMSGSKDLGSAITDAVSQVNSLVVGLSPTVSMGSLFQTQSFNTYMAALNAVQSQQQSAIVHQTATAENVMKMMRS